MFGGIFGRGSSSSSSNQFGQVEDGILTIQLSSGTKWEIIKMKDVGHHDIVFDDPPGGKRRKGNSTVIKVSDNSSMTELVDYMNKHNFETGKWRYYCAASGYLSLYQFADGHSIEELKTLIYTAFERWIKIYSPSIDLIKGVLDVSNGGSKLPKNMRDLIVKRLAEICVNPTEADRQKWQSFSLRPDLRSDLRTKVEAIRAMRTMRAMGAMQTSDSEISEISDLELPS